MKLTSDLNYTKNRIKEIWYLSNTDATRTILAITSIWWATVMLFTTSGEHIPGKIILSITSQAVWAAVFYLYGIMSFVSLLCVKVPFKKFDILTHSFGFVLWMSTTILVIYPYIFNGKVLPLMPSAHIILSFAAGWVLYRTIFAGKRLR